jgi:hypothetical protein
MSHHSEAISQNLYSILEALEKLKMSAHPAGINQLAEKMPRFQ